MTFSLPPHASAIIKVVHQHWIGLRPAPRILPGRQHFDPAALAAESPEALPHLWLLQIETDPRRYRLRLIGSALKAAGSPGRVGDCIDSIDETGGVVRWLDGICDGREPNYRRGPPKLPHGGHVAELENLVLPLAADGRTVDMLLACTIYHWREGQAPQRMMLG